MTTTSERVCVHGSESDTTPLARGPGEPSLRPGSRDAAEWFWLPVYSLWRREVVRFLRQRSRVIGAVATPLVFWILIGSGLGRSFQMPGGSDGSAVSTHYLEYFYPGTLVLIVLFTSIFSNISMIEDRREGFLQSVLVAPVSRSAVVFGKVLGSASLALVQAGVFLALAPFAGIPLTISVAAVSLLALSVLALAMSALGFLVAWPMESTQGFHAIMNLVLMPLWFLSGALFPMSGASPWVQWLMRINPLSYGLAAVRHSLYADPSRWEGVLPSFAASIAVTSVFAISAIVVGARWVRRR